MRRGSLPLLAAMLFAVAASARPGRVHPRDVEAITLRAGSYTESRRTLRIPQLLAVHAPPYISWRPDSVQCTNAGWDGTDVQWRCEAHDMPVNVKFGRMDVNCEGFDSPDDEYILAGSCGLEYELLPLNIDPSPPPPSPPAYRHMDQNTTAADVAVLVYFITIVGCIFCVYWAIEALGECLRSARYTARSHTYNDYQHYPYDQRPVETVHVYQRPWSWRSSSSSSSSSFAPSTRTGTGFARSKRR